MKKISIYLVLMGLLASPVCPAQAQADKGRPSSSAAKPLARTDVAQQPQRVALVIGNSAYKDAPLLNPVNDARAMAQSLRDSGFVVIARENADQRAMLNALREFGDRLRSGGSAVGVFYYAGHGMQIKGRNYLIPVGATIEREDEVAYAALDGQAVLDKMEAAGNATNIMILDACRNNPFARSFRSGAVGLAQMDAPVGTLVSFATAPGSVASDGMGDNGLFTQHLLTAMRQPGIKVEDVFKQVRSNVRRDSQGKQVPWEATSLEGDFYFVPMLSQPAAALATAPVVPDVSAVVESALWDAVKQSADALDLRAYLGRYPEGKFARQARERLDKLENAIKKAAIKDQLTGASGQNSSKVTAKPPSGGVAASSTSFPAAVPDTESQAAIDRRTDEILAELTRKSPSLTQASGAKPTESKSKTTARSNAFGFTVGDRWRYQVVDKYKGEVVENRSVRVDAILPGGGFMSGKTKFTPDGNIQSYSNEAFTSREYTEHHHFLPKELRVGNKENFAFKDVVIRTNGKNFVQEWEGSLVVKGKEPVRVPAGEFEAFRIEREASVSGKPTGSGRNWYGRNTMTLWYVPEIRRYVAYDEVHRVDNQPADHIRVELTSFELAPATVAKK